jgi:hypothetical protein
MILHMTVVRVNRISKSIWATYMMWAREAWHKATSPLRTHKHCVPPYTGCPTTYQTRHFFNNSKTNEDIATRFEQEYVRCMRNKEECVCSVPSCCDMEQRSASQPVLLRPSAYLSVIWLKVPTQYGCCSWVQCTMWVHTVGKCIGILWRSECLLFALIGKHNW